ncbi:MAG TPA: porin, partial [Xanthobacteraceae bacterium]|nr:porin [Xanthobacteraceae bacterium]
LILNLPWQQGDTFGVSFVYSNGALEYVGNQNNYTFYKGSEVALGFIANGVYTGTSAATGTGIELTTGWSVTAGLEHYWTPALRTSLYGAYQKYEYNDVATSRVCTASAAQLNLGLVGGASTCNPDFSVWQIGSRTVWNPVKNLDVGVEVIYSKIQSAFGGSANLPSVGSQAAGTTYNITDLDQVAGMFRVQRNFNP